jgi:type IV pilus assembly protein PilM
MAHRFIGIDLGTHHAKFVVAAGSVRGVQILATHEEPVESGVEGDASLEAAISVAIAVVRARNWQHDPVAVALPGTLGHYRLLQFPFADARRISQAVGFESDGQFPVPLDELAHDHVIVEPPAGAAGGRALVVATRSERVKLVLDSFAAAGIHVKVLTVGPLALAQAVDPRIVEVPPSDAGPPRAAATLVVDIGHRATSLIALGAKGPLAVRALRRGGREVTAAIAREFHQSLAAAEAAKRKDGFLPHRGLGAISPEQLHAGRVVASAMEPVLREIEHTRMWLRASYGYEVTRVWIAGGGAALHGLDAYLAEQTSLPVERVGTHAAAAVKSGLPDGGLGGWGVALGAAMGAARRPFVQFQEAKGPEADGAWLRERMVTLMGAAVAIMAAGALDTLAQVKAVEAERDARVAELAAVSSRIFGEELSTTADVEGRLAEVEGQDLVSLVPSRGALEVLEMIADAARPATPAPAATAPAAEGGSGGSEEAPAGEPAPAATPDADPNAGSDAASGAARPPPPVDPNSGITADDALVVAYVDIREEKIELRASATRPSAQDRFAMKLQAGGCINNVSKGKVRDQNELKVFEMSMDHGCFASTASPAKEEP